MLCFKIMLLLIIEFVPQMKISYKGSCGVDSFSAVDRNRVGVTVAVVKGGSYQVSDYLMILMV